MSKENTVEVPKEWLKKLLKISNETKCFSDLEYLQGYIESAEALLGDNNA